MRQLGEQWVEDGRMWKVVPSGLCDGCAFNMGCLQNGGVRCKNGHCVTKQGHVKDLGPVNEDGCLAEERTGLFPVVENRFHNLWAVTVSIDDFVKTVQVTCYGDNKQEAIDAWNRRA